MAEEKLPNRSPWLDDIKKTKQLTIYFHDSLGRAGWEQVFKDAIFLFNNKLSGSSNHNLGVTFVQEGDRKKSQCGSPGIEGNCRD